MCTTFYCVRRRCCVRNYTRLLNVCVFSESKQSTAEQIRELVYIAGQPEKELLYTDLCTIQVEDLEPLQFLKISWHSLLMNMLRFREQKNDEINTFFGIWGCWWSLSLKYKQIRRVCFCNVVNINLNIHKLFHGGNTRRPGFFMNLLTIYHFFGPELGRL